MNNKINLISKGNKKLMNRKNPDNREPIRPQILINFKDNTEINKKIKNKTIIMQ